MTVTGSIDSIAGSTVFDCKTDALRVRYPLPGITPVLTLVERTVHPDPVLIDTATLMELGGTKTLDLPQASSSVPLKTPWGVLLPVTLTTFLFVDFDFDDDIVGFTFSSYEIACIFLFGESFDCVVIDVLVESVSVWMTGD